MLNLCGKQVVDILRTVVVLVSWATVAQSEPKREQLKIEKLLGIFLKNS